MHVDSPTIPPLASLLEPHGIPVFITEVSTPFKLIQLTEVTVTDQSFFSLGERNLFQSSPFFLRSSINFSTFFEVIFTPPQKNTGSLATILASSSLVYLGFFFFAIVNQLSVHVVNLMEQASCEKTIQSHVAFLSFLVKILEVHSLGPDDFKVLAGKR